MKALRFSRKEGRYAAAVVNYNRAQIDLLAAIGLINAESMGLELPAEPVAAVPADD